MLSQVCGGGARGGGAPLTAAAHILSLSIPPPPIPVEKVKSHLELPLEENLNRRAQEEGSLEARTVEDAIAVLRWAWPVGGGAGPCRHGRGLGMDFES